MSEDLDNKESKSPKRIVLEIGPGTNPHFSKRKDLGINTVYIGIDNQLGAVFTNDALKTQHLKGGGVEGDGKVLPLANSSCDEVVLANVFGISGIGLGKTGHLIDYSDSDSIISEAKRVIKESGVCIVVEAYTPPDKEKIIDKFKKYGLSLILDSSDPELLNAYTNPNQRPSDTISYLLKFENQNKGANY